MNKELHGLHLFKRGKSKLQIAMTTFFIIMLASASVFTLIYTYTQTSNASLRSARQLMKSSRTTISRDILRYMGTARRTVRSVSLGFKNFKLIKDNKQTIFDIISGLLVAHREIFTINVADSTGSLLRVGKIFDDPKYSVDKTKNLPPEVVYRSRYVDLVSRPKVDYYAYYDKDFKEISRETVSPDKITFDARTRDWYKDASSKKTNIWTDIRVYSNGEYGASNTQAIIDENGNAKLVVSASIALSLRDGISSRLTVGEKGIAFLLDEEGKLIAYPDQKKIINCKPRVQGQRAQCEFNNVKQIGNNALAEAFERYKQRSDFSKIINIPARLNFLDYSRSIKRLDDNKRKLFNKAYTMNEKEKTILLNKPLSEEVIKNIEKILESIRYAYYLRFDSQNEEYLASFGGFPESYGKPWMIGILVPINEFIGVLKKTITNIIIISVLILLFSLITILLFTHHILRPLKFIAQDMNKIQNLDIDETITHKSFFFEISIIANALSSMKHGLKAFSKFVPYTLVKQLIISGKGAELGGEKRRLTIMFTDIANFTTISESMTTEALLNHISEYLDELTKIILSNKGTVDKYIGDAIMSFWGAPIDDNEQEYNCAKAALLCIRKLKELNKKWEKEGKPVLNTRVGISSGDVNVGNMGSSDRLNYTVLGDSVNLASRLEAINKYYGTSIIVGEETYNAIKTHFSFRPVDVVAVKGKTMGVKIYQLIAGVLDDAYIAPTDDDLKSIDLTTKAFNAYLNRDFKTSLDLYSRLSVLFPSDTIAEIFIKRCKEYLVNPPSINWDGVFQMKEK